jgi:hypothetical protein
MRYLVWWIRNEKVKFEADKYNNFINLHKILRMSVVGNDLCLILLKRRHILCVVYCNINIIYFLSIIIDFFCTKCFIYLFYFVLNVRNCVCVCMFIYAVKIVMSFMCFTYIFTESKRCCHMTIGNPIRR